MIESVVSRRWALGLATGAVASLAIRPAIAAGPAPVSRIVSLGGAATETLYALGCGDRIAAVDVTSRFPAVARAKPNVGYYRQLSAEGVLALSPDLVLAADGAGPKEALDVLASASVRLVLLAEVRRAADIPARIRAIAEAVGESARGEELATAVEADLATLRNSLAQIEKPRRTLVLLGPSRGTALMAGGAGSSGALALELAGAKNAADGASGWKPLTDEAAYGAEPEAIVVLATSGPVTAEDIAARPGLSLSPAVKEGRIVVTDALSFIGFGPRAAHAARAVAHGIYPEAALPKLPPRAWTQDGAPQK